MAGWSTHKGKALALAIDNIDTDQLIPARFMSAPRRDGYGRYLLHDMRRDSELQLMQDFPLNRHEDVSILVAGRNFGSGSSREAAVYALVDAGVRAVVAPSFGDIFANNAVNNGLLPARVDEDVARQFVHVLGDGTAELSIDLEKGVLALGDLRASFALDESWREKLVNGWDDIDLTRRRLPEIARFRNERRRTTPWAWPATVE